MSLAPEFATRWVAPAARLYTYLVTVAVVFQWALAWGMPWGELAWGGAYPGVLPGAMRRASLGSSLLLLGMVWVVRVRAGLTPSRHKRLARTLVWVVVAYCAVGIAANLASPSFWERVVWAPAVALMFGASLVVAKSP